MSFTNNHLVTLSHQYHVARALAAGDTYVDLTSEGDYASMPSDVLDLSRRDIVTPRDKTVFPELVANGIVFTFAATGGADKDLYWRLLAWRNGNGPAEYVADGESVTGTQTVVKWPHNGVAPTNTTYWCDTITITNDYWLKEIETTTSGSNSIAKLWLDTCGYRYWKMEIDVTNQNLDDAATQVACFYGYW